MPRSEMQISIRRCNGNRDCWAAVCGPNDFLMATSYSLDQLVSLIHQRHGAQAINLKTGDDHAAQ